MRWQRCWPQVIGGGALQGRGKKAWGWGGGGVGRVRCRMRERAWREERCRCEGGGRECEMLHERVGQPLVAVGE